VQVKVTVWDVVCEVSETLPLLRLQAEPPFCERLTVPVNPFSDEIVMVDVPGLPAFAGAGVVAVIEKSRGALKVNVAVVE
jgi:hypothetical protein